MRWILYAQGLLVLLGAAVFGIGFPLLGLGMATTGVAPDGEDPLGMGMVLGVAGPLTAVCYLPGGVLSLVAGWKVGADRENATKWVAVASIASMVLCPLGGLPLLVWMLGSPEKDRPPER
jgi:hypothetical protein